MMIGAIGFKTVSALSLAGADLILTGCNPEKGSLGPRRLHSLLARRGMLKAPSGCERSQKN